MTTEEPIQVPVWTLTSEDTDVPQVADASAMTPQRLVKLRTVLASLAETPIATLEAHPITEKRPRAGGISLGAASPLAKELSTLVAETAAKTPTAAKVAASGDVLYRMVVPAKVAAQVGNGLVRPMASKAAVGGIRGALVNSRGIAGQASFVPVASTGAGKAAARAGGMTLAAPLMLMAVAAGVSAYADYERDLAIRRITELLEQLQQERLDEERNRLDGCRDAIQKATAVLLDRGRVGVGLGLDTSVFEINVAVERASRRLSKWQEALSRVKGPVEVGIIAKAFPGVTGTGDGEFRAHLELAKLAITLKRRVLVLQAVEHAQLEGANHPFRTFVDTLRKDEQRIDELESGLVGVLRGLATLEIKRYGGIRSIYFSQGEVDDLLKAAYRLRAIGDEVAAHDQQADVIIEIEQSPDGSVVVFPSLTA